MAMMRYCLDCGYSREGLSQDAVCPECGEADSFEKQREICTALANKPLSLLWRVMTLRRLPKGWWVVFENQCPQRFKPWQFVLAGVLIVLTLGALSLFVRIESTTISYLYDINDPQQSVIAEVSVRTDRHHLTTLGSSYEIHFLQGYAQLVGPNLRTGYNRSTRFAFGRDPLGSGPELTFVRYLLAYSIVVWILNRFVWLPLIARDRRLSAFRRAAQHTAVIYAAHVFGLVVASVVGFLATLTMSLISTVPLHWINIPWVILLQVMMIFGPAVIWWRVISADNHKYEFPRRISACQFLVGFTLLASVAVFTWPWF